MTTKRPRYSGGKLHQLGWVQVQMLLILLDRYRAIEAGAEPEALATLAANGIRCSPRDLVDTPDHPNLTAVVGHAAQNLEQRGFIARSPVRRVGGNATERDVRLLPAGRSHAEGLAVLREDAPEQLAGPVRSPRRPDATTNDGPLWQGLEPALAEEAQHLLAKLAPADMMTLGMLLVRESVIRGAGDGAHRAAFSLQEVAALLKVSPAFVQLEISRGALQASRLGKGYRIMPENLQAWLEQKRPDRRVREQRDPNR